MKILLLHLSDIHFEKRGDISNSHIEGIAKVLKTLEKCSTVIVVLSGDIAYAGKYTQYNTAYEWLARLKKEMKKQLSNIDVKIVIVPGNHDVDYTKGSMKHDEIQKMYAEGEQDKYIFDEIKKMDAFYNHANGLNCFSDKKSLVSVKEFSFSDVKIKFNLINTAAFSLLEEDQGMHYLPKYDLMKLGEQKSDFIVTVMHHPHHWFNTIMKKELEKIIYETSDLLFVGHEHYSSTMNVAMNDSCIKILAGGELSNKGNWDNSEFYVGVLDLNTRVFRHLRYVWELKNKIYLQKDDTSAALSKNRHNIYQLVPNKEYLNDMLCDRKYMISSNLIDYYVFPALEEEVIREKRVGKEITEINQFVDEIYKHKKIIISGRGDSGKSTLLKAVFNKLIETKVVLLLCGSDIKKGYEQTIKAVFEECYSHEQVEYEKFKQVPVKDKILLIDDSDSLEPHILKDILIKAECDFSNIVYTCGKIVELDVTERIKTNVLEEDSVRYKMQPFYMDKRRELVTNIVEILVHQDERGQHNIISLLCEALSKQKKLFRMDPDFIVQFVKYYCNNIGETIQNDGEVFSKVFEANIVSLLKPNAGTLSVDKILIVLDKIAYGMHCGKKYPMNQKDIFEIISGYNEEFDSDVNYVTFLNILEVSKILIEKNTNYYFSEKNYLAYFVAREIKRKCIEDHDYHEFERALEFSCYGINSEILLFVTYITDNLNLIKLIMEKTEAYTADWTEFSINPIQIAYLSDVGRLKVEAIKSEDKENSDKDEIEREKKILHEEEKAQIGCEVYTYDEENELTALNKIIRALSLINIVSRTLPSFEHMMRKEDKVKCVMLIYSLPLKIFNVWAESVEESKYELIEEIKNLHDWDYRKEKTELSDDDVINYLRWESMSLLMELMNSTIVNATKINTFKFIDAYDYKQNELYNIEHIMALGKRDLVGEFIKEVELLFAKEKNRFVKLMLQRVTKHFILTSDNIRRENIQRLNEKIWKGTLNNTQTLIAKKRNKDKKQ